MNKTKVIVVFDIGKTNKKVLLFDDQMKVVFQQEDKFKTVIDEDGFECDDIDLIEEWMLTTLNELVLSDKYSVKAVNFSTYGASLAYLDENGERLTPIYNYLKEVNPSIEKALFAQYGGKDEFCRKTASPALGLLLNSGIQLLWLKQTKEKVYHQVKAALHFPQYLSYLLTKEIVAESTSIGCHTFMWDFDRQEYHQWLKDEVIDLPKPLSNSYKINTKIAGEDVAVGIGIHDSSSSLVPYLKGSQSPFLLVSTGTWCINMNPFNHTPLTACQLQKDCLSFLSVNQKPVKSSRLFMGHIHDVNVKRLTDFFKVPGDSYKKVETKDSLLKNYLSNSSKHHVFFKNGMPANYIDETADLSSFQDFSEAYHRFMFDLTLLNAESIDLICELNDGVKSIYVSGGFARNEIFVRLLANLYSDKKVYTSEVDNSSAMGAALVVWDALTQDKDPQIDLGLMEWKSYN